MWTQVLKLNSVAKLYFLEFILTCPNLLKSFQFFPPLQFLYKFQRAIWINNIPKNMAATELFEFLDCKAVSSSLL